MITSRAKITNVRNFNTTSCPQKVIGLAIVTALCFSLLLISAPVKAKEDDDCGFGKIDFGYPDCPDNYWSEFEEDDGFSRTYTISIDGDNTRSDGSMYWMEVQCSARKLSILVYSDDLIPVTNRRGLGTALVRIDRGRIDSLTYKNWNNSGISIQSPKKLTGAMLRGGTKLAFKIPTIYGPEIANFAMADFSAFASRFRRSGCPLN
jgi:hypothetical protein